MRLSHDWGRGTAVFDDENLVSCAGLVPVMELAEQTGMNENTIKVKLFRASLTVGFLTEILSS